MPIRYFNSYNAAVIYAKQESFLNTNKTYLATHDDIGYCVIENNELFHEQPTWIELELYHNARQLMQLLVNGNREAAKRFLDIPFEPNYFNHYGSSLLMVAAYRGYSDICEKLIQAGADCLYGYYYVDCDDTFDMCSDSVLIRAKMSHNDDTYDTILKYYIISTWSLEAKLMKINESKTCIGEFQEMLSDAARLGMTSLCVDMVTSGVPINFTAHNYESPLFEAYSNNKMQTCLVLLALGADIEELKYEENYSIKLKQSINILNDFFN